MRALVTGATRGIGRSTVGHLLASGAEVAAVGRDPSALLELTSSFGGSLTTHVADVTDLAALEAAVSDTGPLDLVVANAGALSATGSIWDADPDEWWGGVETNLRGAYLTVRAVLPSMLEAGRGRIVLMTSGFGNAPGPHLSQYATSKAAVTVLGESLEIELEGTGVHCFLVSPGMVATDMTRFPETLTRHRPDLADLPAEAFLAVDRVLGLLDAIATGRLDALAGRFLHSTDDLDALLAAVDPADPRPRTLRLAGAWPSDPRAG